MTATNQPFYWQILENIRDGLCFADKNKIITFWNRAAEEISGYRRGEILGRPCCERVIIHTDENGEPLCGADRCATARAVEQGESFSCRASLKKKDGAEISVRVRFDPIRDEKGNTVGATQTFWPS